MKCMKKIVSLATALAMGCATSFAIETDDIEPQFNGNMTRKEFSKEMDEITDEDMKECLVELLSEGFIEGLEESFAEDGMEGLPDEFFEALFSEAVTISDCHLLKKTSDITEEVRKMHGYYEAKFPKDAKKNDTFTDCIVNEYSDDGMDGWFISSHYMSAKNILSYIYYFKIEIDFENIDYESLFEELLGDYDYEYDCD